MIEIISPLPVEAIPLVWEWARESPGHNFDDYGPETFEQLEAAIIERQERERTWGVKVDGEFVGFVGYIPTSHRTGMMHGILFAQKVHGKGIAREAMRQIFNSLFAAGVEKIAAGYFAQNLQVHRFLHKLGAIEEGYLREQTVQRGQKLDMRLVAIFKGNWPCQ